MQPSSASRTTTDRTRPSYSTYQTSRWPGSTSIISGDAPSLSHESTNALSSAPESSISTDLASLVPGMTLLQETADGVLETASSHPAIGPRPVYECTFNFLNCRFISVSESEWQTHCLAHWYGHAPPRRVMCPLCNAFGPEGREYSDGHVAWQQRMAHIAMHHGQGETLATARPDFRLFRHLWQKRIIDDAEYKELQGWHRLSEARGPYQTTQGVRMDERHRRHPRQPVA